MLKVGLLFLITKFSLLESKEQDLFIVQGDELKIEDVPYQCYVTRNFKPICGCVIIHRRYVLSAGHCFSLMMRDKNSTEEKSLLFGSGANAIVAGASSTNERGSIYNISSVVVHPHFDFGNTPTSDISLVRVHPEIQFNDRIQPIRLNEDVLRTGEMLLVSGFGSRIPNKKSDVSEKKKVGLPKLKSLSSLYGAYLAVYDYGECKKQYMKKGVLLDDSFICALGWQKGSIPDACQGDSGGPLVTKNMKRLVGLVSFGFGCGNPYQPPPTYTKISKFVPWIRSYVKDLRTQSFEYNFVGISSINRKPLRLHNKFW